MAAERTARAIWTGSLMEGSGRVSATSSGLFADAPVTWASRTEASDGRYTAKDNMIVVNPGKGIAQLWTVRQFPTDFELRLELCGKACSSLDVGREDRSGEPAPTATTADCGHARESRGLEVVGSGVSFLSSAGMAACLSGAQP